jgi:hypothetical protein
MRYLNRLSIAAFLSLCYPRCYARCLAFALLLVGSVAGSAIAIEHASSTNAEAWLGHAALQPFDVRGKKLPSTLFLVRTRGELPEADGVVVHGVHNGVFLVSGDPTVVQGLAQRGCAVIRLYDSPTPPPPAARDWTWIDAPDPDIEAMVAEVEWTGVIEKIQWLVDFGTRYGFAPNHYDVARSISDAFGAYGLQTTLRPFDFQGTTMWNVEATQTGTTYPNSFVIICGHFDSLSEQPMTLAPGADDNATGAAAVLTAAEILSQHAFDYSIRYICFSGEEQGLVGSYYYTVWALTNNLDIVGLLNFDMLGYWEAGVEKDLEIETNYASQWLAQAVVNAADLYTDTPYELHVDDWAWWGDHFWFWMGGYSAVNHEESWDWADPDFSPHYHTSTDLPEYLDPDFTVGNIKVGVAALATLANAGTPQSVSFDVRPGSCPNPFNPKSRGVVPALLLGSTEIDARDVIPASLRLEGSVSPSMIRVADMGSTGDNHGHPCADMSPDGFTDLSLKFSTNEIAAVLGPVAKGDAVGLHLTGRLVDGTVFEGEDVVMIVGDQGGLQQAVRTFDEPLTDEETVVRETVLPEVFALYQNVPNPFNPTTNIRFDLPPGGGAVTLRIYDVGGRLVRTLVNETQTAGRKTVAWDGLNEAGNPVATGTYFYRLAGPGFEQTRKMVHLK